MRKLLRDAIAQARLEGATVVNVIEAGRHTEVILDFGAGRRGLIRLHRGAKTKMRAAPALRAAIRGIKQERLR